MRLISRRKGGIDPIMQGCHDLGKGVGIRVLMRCGRELAERLLRDIL
jgi:hypothetical protein